MRLIIFILAAMACTPALAEEPVSFQKIDEVPLSQQQIFDSSLIWLAETFRDSEEVIEYKDRDTGTIIGNGIVETKGGMFLAPPNKSRFQLRIDTKEGRYRLTFSKVELWVGDYGTTWKPIEEANRQMLEPKILERFEQIAQDFKSGVQKEAAAAGGKDW